MGEDDELEMVDLDAMDQINAMVNGLEQEMVSQAVGGSLGNGAGWADALGQLGDKGFSGAGPKEWGAWSNPQPGEQALPVPGQQELQHAERSLQARENWQDFLAEQERNYQQMYGGGQNLSDGKPDLMREAGQFSAQGNRSGVGNPPGVGGQQVNDARSPLSQAMMGELPEIPRMAIVGNNQSEEFKPAASYASSFPTSMQNPLIAALRSPMVGYHRPAYPVEYHPIEKPKRNLSEED